MTHPNLTPEERRDRGARLCRRLSEDVASVAPPALGRWNRAWEIVAEPSAEFIAVLTAWEASPSESTLDAVRAAYSSVVDAWKRAAREYRQEGVARR